MASRVASGRRFRAVVLAALVLALAWIAAGALPAHAGPESDPGSLEARRRLAGEHVQKGDHFKDAGDFKAAETEYQKAYDLVPHPLLLFDLAQVHRLDGDKKVALDYYRRYLKASPDGPAAAQARHYVSELETELGHSEDHGQPHGSQGGQGDHHDHGHSGGGHGDGATHGSGSAHAGGSGTGGGAGGGGGSDHAAGGGTDLTVGKSATHHDPGRWMRLGGIASAGVGALSIALGIKYGLDARRISNELSDHTGPWSEELLAEQADGKSANRKMIIFSAVGGVAVVGGAVLYYLGHQRGASSEEAQAGDGDLTDEEDDGLSLAPVLSPGAAGLVVGGHF